MLINLRNALMAGKRWKNPYITDGLVAMWDGEWNAGGGVHDANATTWKDLVGNRDLVLTQLGSFEANCLLNRTGGVGASLDDRLSGYGTLEVVFSASGHYKYATVCYVCLGGGFYFGQRNNIVNGNYRTETAVYGRIADINVSTSGIASWSMTRTGGVGEIRKNGVQQALTEISVQGAQATPISLNATSYDNRFFNIRAYSRALTAAEIARNYAIDKERFDLT